MIPTAMWSDTLDWIRGIPPLTSALAGTLLLVNAIALAVSRRGGRFRRLRSWAVFWLLFGTVLISLEHVPRWLSFPMLAAVMYASLRDYFFVAPVRPRDRYVILAAYLTIPVALTPAYRGEVDTFLAVVPTALVLFIPAFLSIGRREAGMLDSAGRSMLGVGFFVFCSAHLALFVGGLEGRIQLFGLLVLASEFPQRVSGGFGEGRPWWKPALGLVVGGALATALGYAIGPWAGLVAEDGARAGLFVFIAVSLGSRVSRAVAQDLDLKASRAHGRGAVLDRVVPAVYAAPVYFHYLNQFI